MILIIYSPVKKGLQAKVVQAVVVIQFISFSLHQTLFFVLHQKFNVWRVKKIPNFIPAIPYMTSACILQFSGSDFYLMLSTGNMLKNSSSAPICLFD